VGLEVEVTEMFEKQLPKRELSPQEFDPARLIGCLHSL
jgi:hypothetical protein